MDRRCLAALVALVGLAAAPAQAQLGIGESASGFLDVHPPDLTIDQAPPEPWVVGGTTFTFRWTMNETLPGPRGSHVARVLIGGAPADSVIQPERTGSFSWNWKAPEIVAAGCRLEVAATDQRGNLAVVRSQPFTIVPSATGVPSLPAAAVLLPPRPNPCNPATEISWLLPAPGHLRVLVYDLRGRLLAVLVDRPAGAGSGSLRWQARDGQGRRLAAGVYHLRLEYAGPAGATTGARRLVVLP